MNKINKIIRDKIVIADDVKIASTLFKKARGLMFSRRLKNNQAMVFINKEESMMESSLHMLFVFYSIDVAWMNKNMEIVDLRERLKPFMLFITPKKAAKYVLEMSAGKIKDVKMRIGDRLKFL